jgi:hypothetical protein
MVLLNLYKQPITVLLYTLQDLQCGDTLLPSMDITLDRCHFHNFENYT